MKVLNITDAPKNYQPALRKGDAVDSDKSYNGSIDTEKEVNAAAKAYCTENEKTCNEFQKWLEQQTGVKPTVEVKGADDSGNIKRSVPIEGYYYSYGDLKMRSKADGSVRISGKANYSGYGVNNGDDPAKADKLIDAKGLNYVMFNITAPTDADGKKLPMKVTRFKVEINNNEVMWIEPKDISDDGLIIVPLDAELFEATGGKIAKFQIVFAPGDVDFQISNIQAVEIAE